MLPTLSLSLSLPSPWFALRSVSLSFSISIVDARSSFLSRCPRRRVSLSHATFLPRVETKLNHLSHHLSLSLSHIHTRTRARTHTHAHTKVSRVRAFLLSARVPRVGHSMLSFSFPRILSPICVSVIPRSALSFSRVLALHPLAARSVLSSLHRRFRPTYPNYNERP